MDNNIMTPTRAYVDRLVKGDPPSLDELFFLPDVPATPGIASIINPALGKKGISVAVAAELSGINKATLFKILGGSVQPKRNTLLRLALTLELDFSETQQLLKAGNVSLLSSSRLRDRVILVGLVNNDSIDEISKTLEKHGFINLYAKV